MAAINKNKFTIEYFRQLIAIAMADGLLKDAEKEFFTDKAEELGIDSDIVVDILTKSDSEINFTNTNQIDNEDFITDLVAIAMIDGELHHNEYELCINFAERKGFSKKEVDDTISQLKKLINSKS